MRRVLGAARVLASAAWANGSLVIVGGGKIPASITSRFVELASSPNANYIVIPTAGDGEIDVAKTKRDFIKQFGVTNVTVLHTRDRTVANTRKFAEPIRHASAVWFPGGRQWRLADSYLNTRTEREIKALLKRGGVVCGTSAGATIQGSYLVRGAVEGNTIMMAKGHETGFALLPNSAIDQHIIKRHREADLDPVIETHPKLLGIGIDESTAIVVRGSRFEVIGDSKVAIHDGKQHGGKGYYFLSPGDQFDLRARRPVHTTAAGN